MSEGGGPGTVAGSAARLKPVWHWWAVRCKENHGRFHAYPRRLTSTVAPLKWLPTCTSWPFLPSSPPPSKVEWLASWRLRDPRHHSPETCLNVDELALSTQMSDDANTNMCLQVGTAWGMQFRCWSGHTRLPG